MTPFFNAWGVVMAEIRRERGLSREHAAVDAGVATSTWYRWENGDTGPGPSQLPAVARGLGMSADELAYRYAGALLRHYEQRLREAAGSGVAEPVEGEPSSPPAGTAVPAAPPAGLESVAAAHGLVLVDLNDLVDKLSKHGAVDPAVARPRRLSTRPSPGVKLRRRKRRP